jgi:AbrB family looped-hinge helix DNA binding protein
MNSNKSKNDGKSILGMVTVNDKGQVVIPAEARTIIDLKSGDKLVVIAHPSHEGVILIKPEGLEQYANKMLEQITQAKDTYRGDND